MEKKVAKVLAVLLAALFLIGSFAFLARDAFAQCCTGSTAPTAQVESEEERKAREEEEKKKQQEEENKKNEEAVKREEESLVRHIQMLISEYENKPGYFDAVAKLKAVLDSYNPRYGRDLRQLRDAISAFAFNEAETKRSPLFTGDEQNRFRPNDPLTRAEFAAILMRMDHVTAEAGSTWYEIPMRHARERGYMKGDEFGNMMPEKTISLAEVIATLVRYKQYPEVPGDEYHLGNHWARGYMQRAYTDGWLKEIENAGQADRPILRGELAAVIVKAQGIKIDRKEIEERMALYRQFADVDKHNPYYYAILVTSN